MQHIDIEAVLQRAKKALNFRTDIELAEFLDIPRSTIASWRRRGSIPARYLAEFTSMDISLDWLLSGKGAEEKTDEYGFIKNGTEEIDTESLWIALVLAVRKISLNNENGPSYSRAGDLTKAELFDLSAHFSFEYYKVINSKQSWRKSGIIKEENLFNALLQEYDLVGDDFVNPPWWEDEDLI